jgi:phosphatidylinositol alpha-1,6-mannosyltransferase
MQRMATELHAALDAHTLVELSSLLLRTSWRWTGFRMAPFGAKLLWRIPRVVAEKKIDVVLFSSMVTAALAPALRGRVQGAAMAAVAVGRDVTLPVRPYQAWVPRVLNELDLVFPISRAAERECLARGLAAENSCVVPVGIDTSRLAPPGDRKAARRALESAAGEQLPADALLLCGVGRHVERKGFHWFVDQVMPRLPADVCFWLAGEGPMTGMVRATVAERGLAERVRLLGRVSDETLALLYRGSDLFVMPNIPVAGDIEGFGIVMLEAGLSGLPTVAAALDGIPDVIQDGQNGELVPAGDAAAFAGAIMGYAGNRSRLAALSQRTAQYVAGTFGWNVVADRYVQLFREWSNAPGN